MSDESELNVRERQQAAATAARERLVGGRVRFLIGVAILLAVAVTNVLIAPRFSIWEVNNQRFSTAELAIESEWIKGAAPILAENFDSVLVTNVNNDVELSFDFDAALAEIYQVATDYTFAPVDVRSAPGDDSGAQGRGLAALLREQGLVQHESDVLCQLQETRHCRLMLVWRKDVALRPLPAVFTAVVLEDKLFALVDRELLDQVPALGSAIDSAENAARGER
jgi:hypothetical protein